jgi:hypothetical protein
MRPEFESLPPSATKRGLFSEKPPLGTPQKIFIDRKFAPREIVCNFFIE